LASAYGTVVNVRLPMKKRIKENDQDKSKITNNDRQSHCGFAFVRFTNKTAAQNIATVSIII
jgi:RNA recognition motif-containing protein